VNHEHAVELLASLALDAVDENERLLIEEHVADCPKCQSELDAMREVAAALGNSVEPLPAHLWSTIANRIYETRDEGVPTLAIVSDDHDPPSIRPRPRSRFVRVLALPLAVAAVVVAVLAFQLVNANQRAANLQSALADSSSSQVAAALQSPGHKVVLLDNSSHARLAKFVLLPDGRGYLVSSSMPALPTNETYQLWGVINGKAISIGLMGSTPRHVAFTVAGPPDPTLLGITVEPAGGTSRPTSAMVASGPV